MAIGWMIWGPITGTSKRLFENRALLGYNAVSSGNYLLTTYWSLFLGFLTPEAEDGTDTLFQNIGKE